MVRLVAWMTLLTVGLAAAAHGQEPVPKARNASQDLLLTVEDYLALLPAGDPIDRVRTAAKAPNAFNSFRENWPTKTGNYHLNLVHKSAGVVLMCNLTVATSEEEAKHIVEESVAGWLSGMGKNNKIQAVPIGGLGALSKDGRFYFIKLESGAPFANLFAVREARNVVVVSLRGPILAADSDFVVRLLGPKLPKLMAFTPAF